MRSGPSLKVSLLALTDESCCLGVAGELDVANAPELTRAVEQALAEDGVVNVTLELGSLEFIDSTGLQCLIDLSQGCSAAGRRLRAIGQKGQVGDLFRLTGVDRVLSV
jgi:anti-sigma B factor antagonist